MKVFAPGLPVTVLDGAPVEPAPSSASGHLTVYAPGEAVEVLDVGPAARPRIEFPEAPSKIVSGRYHVYWGHMHTLGMDEYDPLDAADYDIEPKTTKFSYSLDPNVPGPLGLQLILNGSTAAKYSHMATWATYAPAGPDRVAFRLPNTVGKTNNGNKWDYYIHTGYASKPIKHRSTNCTVAAIEYLRARFPKIDTSIKGITINGQSMGAVGSLAQSMSLPDSIRRDIVAISGMVGFNLFRKYIGANTSRHFAGPDSEHWALIDMRERASDPIQQDIYHHAVSTINDNSTKYDPEFSALLQQYKIPHRMVFSNGTHGTPIFDSGVASRLSASSWYESAECGRDNVKPFPAFSGSTADWQSDQHGYFNLGLAWHHTQTTHTQDNISIPIRYLAKTGIGGGFQDQPASTTVTITPRKLHGLSIEGWSWSYLSQSGVVIDGSATITMQSSPTYAPIVFTRAAP